MCGNALARLPQRQEYIQSETGPFADYSIKHFLKKILILAFEANSAASLDCTFFLILAHFVIILCT